MSNSSDDSACYSYQRLDDSPVATSSPGRPVPLGQNLSSDSTTQLIGSDSNSSHSLSGQTIFVPDADTIMVNGSPEGKHEHKAKLKRQQHVVDTDEAPIQEVLEPLAEQEVVHSSQDRIPVLHIEDTDEVFQSSNPNVIFKKASLTSCEWLDDDLAFSLHTFRDTAACTTHLTSTPICAELAPSLDTNFGEQYSYRRKLTWKENLFSG